MKVSDKATDAGLALLQAELARIDVRLRRRVLLWRRAGRDPADVYRGLYVSDADAEALLRRPLGTHWGQFVSLTDEERRQFDEAERQASQEAERIRARAARADMELPLDRLTRGFGLSDLERDAFLIALAPSLDERYERVYGYLHDDVTRKRASPQLVLDLLGEQGPLRLHQLQAFSDGAPLLGHRLLRWGGQAADQEGGILSRPLEVDGTVLRWLLGHYQPGNVPGARMTFERPRSDALDRARIGRGLEQALADPYELDATVLTLSGPDGLAQDALARRVAAARGVPLLRLEFRGEQRGSLRQAFEVMCRDALLTQAVIHISGLHRLEDEALAERVLKESLAEFEGTVVFSSPVDRPSWSGRLPGQRNIEISCPLPDVERRLELWRAELAAREVQVEDGLAEVASQFQLSSGKIRAAAQAAVDRAAQEDRRPTRGDLFAAARGHSNPKLAELATKVEPRYLWSDLILPQDQLAMLRELVATVRQRHRVLDQWGVGDKLVSGRGVRALFAGPPGTGKTMAAGILAGELGLDLYKIDLSTVVSKYIGETEKNLEKVFAEASTSNAILFFDEADALFGKRSEVRDSHDRYANLEISYLLQRMESYDGVTILATNLRANLDDAFTRRLDFAVDFPFPEQEDRLRIWRTLLPPGVPQGEELDLAHMAREYKLAGGNIRNVLVSAAYLAAADGGRVTMEHLQHGARRELQKMGRWIRVPSENTSQSPDGHTEGTGSR